MKQVDQFNYRVFAARNYRASQESTLRNQAYVNWWTVWNKIYRDSKSNFKLTADQFIRQDLVCALYCQDRIAALHLYSFFDLDSRADLESEYFHFFNENYLSQLRSFGVRTVMSMEYLTVTEEFRKSVLGFSAASLIAELGTRVFGLSGADAIVAPARNDVKVNEMAYDIGFRCLQKETSQRGFICDLVACLQGDQKRSDLPLISEFADDLWRRKQLAPSVEQYFLSPTKTARKVA